MPFSLRHTNKKKGLIKKHHNGLHFPWQQRIETLQYAKAFNLLTQGGRIDTAMANKLSKNSKVKRTEIFLTRNSCNHSKKKEQRTRYCVIATEMKELTKTHPSVILCMRLTKKKPVTKNYCGSYCYLRSARKNFCQ